MSTDRREQALARFKRIRPFLEEGVPLTNLAQYHQIPLGTLRGWVKRYRREG